MKRAQKESQQEARYLRERKSALTFTEDIIIIAR
jgi:hypothetical protein